MESWKIFLFVAIAAAIAVYAFNSLGETLRQEKDQASSDYINKSINAKFDENFQRQNVLGNVTVEPIIKLETDIKSLLENRTARFDAIQEKQDIIIANERTIIHNQYIYSLPDNLNVTGISNETR